MATKEFNSQTSLDRTWVGIANLLAMTEVGEPALLSKEDVFSGLSAAGYPRLFASWDVAVKYPLAAVIIPPPRPSDIAEADDTISRTGLYFAKADPPTGTTLDTAAYFVDLLSGVAEPIDLETILQDIQDNEDDIIGLDSRVDIIEEELSIESLQDLYRRSVVALGNGYNLRYGAVTAGSVGLTGQALVAGQLRNIGLDSPTVVNIPVADLTYVENLPENQPAEDQEVNGVWESHVTQDIAYNMNIRYGATGQGYYPHGGVPITVLNAQSIGAHLELQIKRAGEAEWGVANQTLPFDVVPVEGNIIHPQDQLNLAHLEGTLLLNDGDKIRLRFVPDGHSTIAAQFSTTIWQGINSRATITQASAIRQLASIGRVSSSWEGSWLQIPIVHAIADSDGLDLEKIGGFVFIFQAFNVWATEDVHQYEASVFVPKGMIIIRPHSERNLLDDKKTVRARFRKDSASYAAITPSEYGDSSGTSKTLRVNFVGSNNKITDIYVRGRNLNSYVRGHLDIRVLV